MAQNSMLMWNSIRLISCVSIHLCYSCSPQKCCLVLLGKGHMSIISPPPTVKVAARMIASLRDFNFIARHTEIKCISSSF